jgi:hypothetical protein
MIGKPFKPLSIKNRPSSPYQNVKSSNGSSEPPTKKRRMSSDSDHGATTEAAAHFAAVPRIVKKVKTFLVHRAPLGVVSNGAVTDKAKADSGGVIEGYYTVLWYVLSLQP